MGRQHRGQPCEAVRMFMGQMFFKRILLVDDDRAFKRALREYLENYGYECKEADDGMEALSMLDGGLRVDVVLSDYHMPVIDGLEFIKALAYRMNGQTTQVILLSGNLTREMEMEAKKHGAFETVKKPYDHQELLTLVARACQDTKGETDNAK